MSPAKLKQLKIGLTGKQRGELDRAAREAGRTLSLEVRHRLEVSLADDERFSAFAKLMGEETKWLAQMVLASTLRDNQIVDPKKEDWEKAAPRILRALIVALNEWFGSVRYTPTTGPDPEADTIGKAAAKNYLLLRSALERRAAEEDDEDSEGEE